MLRLRYCLVLLCISASFVALLPRDCAAQINSVVIESKEVLPGATAVMIGVYVSNAAPIVAVVFPFEFRTIGSASEPHAFTQGPVWRDWNPEGRAYSSPLGPNSPSGSSGAITKSWYSASGGAQCSGPASGTYSVANEVYDGVSPDGSLFEAHSTSCGEGCDGDIDLDAGSEIVGVNAPSFLIQFDVNAIEGQFEIDTCCVRPANHLFYVDRNTQIVQVTFTKGIISVGCFCRCHGDPECDGATDILDVVRAINTAFRNAPESLDQDCTHSRTDVDVSGVTDVLDVVKMIAVVLNDGPVEGNITDPCAQ